MYRSEQCRVGTCSDSVDGGDLCLCRDAFIWLGKESKDLDMFLWLNAVVFSAMKFMSYHFLTRQEFVESDCQ